MNIRLNRILIAIIAAALGLLILAGRLLGGALISPGGIVFIGAGLAFIMLYRSKGKSWAVVPGAYLLYIGCCQTFGGFLPFWGGRFSAAAFFIVPGIICFLLWRKTRRKGFIAAASFLLWFGAFLAAESLPLPGFIHGALFPAAMFAACRTVSLQTGTGGFLRILGYVFLAAAALAVGAEALTYGIAFALIAVGGIIAYGAVKKRRAGGSDHFEN
jgi:hypothetical protein